MKVIFLDVDGVLNSVEDRFSWTIETDKHLKLLKYIIDNTNAKIVISSSWRILSGTKNTLIKRLKDFNIEVYSETPHLCSDGIRRGDEIRQWLKENKEIENFVILDDESDMREFTKTNLFQTNMEIGLTKDIADKVIEFLNRGQEYAK